MCVYAPLLLWTVGLHVLFMYAGMSRARGKIHLMAEELQDNKFDIHFELAASKLEKKDLFGKVCNIPLS